MEQLLQNYIKSFKIHVATKTTDKVLHDFLADVYGFFFDVIHTLSEKRQDLWLDPSIDCDKASSSMMTLLQSEKDVLEKMVKEKNSYGMDDQLRTLLNTLEWLMGTAKWFIEDEKEEKSEMPKLGIPTPLSKK